MMSGIYFKILDEKEILRIDEKDGKMFVCFVFQNALNCCLWVIDEGLLFFILLGIFDNVIVKSKIYKLKSIHSLNVLSISLDLS